jgi:hypothetical protein
MNRQQNRARIKEAQKLFKLPAGELKPIDLSKREHPDWMTRAFMNNRYVVMIDDNARTDKGCAIKAMIQKHDDSPIVNHWSEMQKIKNELFGTETMAVEYYPKESQLMNDHNIYWLWVFPQGILPIPKV